MRKLGGLIGRKAAANKRIRRISLERLESRYALTCAGTVNLPMETILEGMPIDYPAEGDVAIESPGTLGTAVIMNGAVRYTPLPSTDGMPGVTDTFSYSIGGAGCTTYIATVAIGNAPPTASFLDNNGPIDAGGTVTVSFVGATDPSTADVSAGLHYSYAIEPDVPAGSYAQATDGPSKEFQFNDPGIYRIYGRIFDKDGGQSSNNNNGVADFSTLVMVNSSNHDVAEGSSFTLNLASLSAGAGPIDDWTIFWGNSSEFINGNPSSVSHTYPDGNASYTILALARHNLTSVVSKSVGITVHNVAPTLAIGGAPSVNEGSPYTLNLSTNDPGADTISSWTINWGDATQVISGNPSSVTHFYSDNSSYTISATATDEDGTYTAGNTVAVIVSNVAPTATISGALQGVRLQTIPFTSVVTDPAGTADTQTSTWQVYNGAALVGGGTGPTFTFTPADVGTYTVKLFATDDDGGVSPTVSQSLTINSSLLQGTTLLMGGAAGNDKVTIKPGSSDGLYNVVLNGANLGNSLPLTAVQVFGGPGNDELTLEGNGASNTMAIYSDHLEMNGLSIFDTGIDSRIINAGGNVDTITVYGGSATVKGGSSADTLIAAAGTNTWTMSSLTAGNLNGQVTFESIEQLVGAGSDSLVGPNTDTTWKLTAFHAGTLGNEPFSGFASLQGGSGKDTFRVDEGIASGVSIDGGGAADKPDKLDYAASLGGVSVNLLAGTATGFAHVSSIENVTGGHGNDILIGDDGVNSINGGDGNDIVLGCAGNDTLQGGHGLDLLIGGQGADSISAGEDDDILIAGTTAYDNNTAALLAILNEWNSAADYATRRANICNGAGGLTGTGYHLFGDSTGPQSQTVFNDNFVDNLKGDADIDWFFANQAGANNDGQAEDKTDRAGSEVWNDTDT